MGRVCVIISTCCPHFSDKAGFLLNLGGTLAEEGHEVKVVLAGRETCSHIIRLHGDDELCKWHFDLFSDLLGSSSGALQPSLVDNDRASSALADTAWLGICSQPTRDRVFEGYALHDICNSSVARRTRGLRGGTSPSHNQDPILVEDSYHKDAVRHLIYYKKLFLEWMPDVAIYFGGHFHQDRCAFLAAKSFGVSTVAIESSFIPSRIYWDPSGVTGNRGGIANGSNTHWSETLVISPSRASVIDRLMMESLNIEDADIRDRDAFRRRAREGLNIQDGERVVLFLSQVPYDASLLSDGGDFRDQVTTVNLLFSLLEGRRGFKLAVRLHPKDLRGELSRHLINIKGGANGPVQTNGSTNADAPSLWSDLAAADIVVTVNSQSGLQAAWCGLPVVLLGKAFYAGKDFTVDLGGQKQLLSESCITAPKVPTAASMSKVYSYLSVLEREYLVDPRDMKGTAARLNNLL